MHTLKAILRSMRPQQWIKNFMVFPAILFTHNLFVTDKLLRILAAFALFCLVSGAVYIINDIRDLPNDRKHPTKRLRPLASGALSVGAAWVAALLLLIFSLGASALWGVKDALVGPWFLMIIAIYLALQFAYSFWLKNLVIIDVMVLAAGFLLRVLAGGAAIGVNEPTNWVVICTVLLALFLGFGKRRHELVIMAENAKEHRKILEEYSPYFLDQMMAVVTASTVVAYALYTMDPDTIAVLGTDKLVLTVPFVLYGIFRYLYLVHQREEGGSPSRVLISDVPLLIDVAMWFVAVLAVLYFT
ncbi:MAG: decaprenyl-phosphate phosphoribosyltransferase [Candidatus Alcyoniella australis]|nr:decaprenyl-phosphate phosphoribosyltransferase [Candidatus Alcyoniella australis]